VKKKGKKLEQKRKCFTVAGYEATGAGGKEGGKPRDLSGLTVMVYAFSSSSLLYSVMHVLFVGKVCEVRCVRFLCGVFAMGCFGLLGSAVGVVGMGDEGRGEGDERCRWVLGEFVEEGGFWVEVVEWLVVDDLPPSSSPFPASFNYSSTSYSASISLSSFLHHRFHLF